MKRLAALIALLLVAAATPAHAVRVGNDGSITITGRGYGHGHGMSQWGAQGAALKGKGWPAIMAHYYPGTQVGTRSRVLKVWITGDRGSDLVVRAVNGLRFVRVDTGRVWLLPDNGTTKWRLTYARGVTTVSYADNGWHRWGRKTGLGQFDRSGDPMQLETSAGLASYRGSLRLVPSGGDRKTVNVIDLEDYLRGVVPAEMPSSWKRAALASQSIAARTYAMWSVNDSPVDAPYDICDTTSCQVYKGAGAETAATDAAIALTVGTVMLKGGEPIFSQFSASSGGWTSAGSQSYLPMQADPWDTFPANYNNQWTVTISRARLSDAWPALGTITRVKVIERDGGGGDVATGWGGRALKVRLTGSNGQTTVSGDSFRLALGLRSTWISLK